MLFGQKLCDRGGAGGKYVRLISERRTPSVVLGGISGLERGLTRRLEASKVPTHTHRQIWRQSTMTTSQLHR